MILENPTSFATLHPNIAYWLDEALKIGAVAIGAAWTFWNFRKSRTYAPKPDLEISGDIFFHGPDLFIDITATLKNLGAGKHVVERAGTYCELFAVGSDLLDESLRLFEVFTLHEGAESGESISDHLLWRINDPPPGIIWLRVDLRVVSRKIERNKSNLVRIPPRPLSSSRESIRRNQDAIQ